MKSFDFFSNRHVSEGMWFCCARARAQQNHIPSLTCRFEKKSKLFIFPMLVQPRESVPCSISGKLTVWLVDWLADWRACWCGQGTTSRRYGARWSVIGWFTLVRALGHSCAARLAFRVCRGWCVVHTLSWVVVDTSHMSIRDVSHGFVKSVAHRWCT